MLVSKLGLTTFEQRKKKFLSVVETVSLNVDVPITGMENHF